MMNNDPNQPGEEKDGKQEVVELPLNNNTLNSNFFFSQPKEITLNIISYLEVEDLAALIRMDKQFRALVSNEFQLDKIEKMPLRWLANPKALAVLFGEDFFSSLKLKDVIGFCEKWIEKKPQALFFLASVLKDSDSLNNWLKTWEEKKDYIAYAAYLLLTNDITKVTVDDLNGFIIEYFDQLSSPICYSLQKTLFFLKYFSSQNRDWENRNAYKESRMGENLYCNLSGLVLQNVVENFPLQGINFSHVVFEKVSLIQILGGTKHSIINNAVFKECDFRYCQFENIIIVNSTLDNVQFSCLKDSLVNNVTLENSVFLKGNLSGTVFHNTMVENTVFTQVDLRQTTFKNVQLNDVLFQESIFMLSSLKGFEKIKIDSALSFKLTKVIDENNYEDSLDLKEYHDLFNKCPLFSICQFEISDTKNREKIINFIYQTCCEYVIKINSRKTLCSFFVIFKKNHLEFKTTETRKVLIAIGNRAIDLLQLENSNPSKLKPIFDLIQGYKIYPNEGDYTKFALMREKLSNSMEGVAISACVKKEDEEIISGFEILRM